MDNPSLGGAVALVTGASSSVGTATAKRLAGQGAAVSLVAPSSDRLAVVVEEIARSGGHAVAIEGDITGHDLAYGVVQETLDRFGRLDMLINSADLRLVNSALHTTLDEWDRMIELNVRALLHITHASVPYLIDAAATSPRQVADLVTLGSTTGRVAQPGSSVYSLTKFGLRGFVESLRQELLSERVRVSLVETSVDDTEGVEHLGEGAADGLRWQAAAVGPRQAEAIADAIVYIVSRERWVAVNQVLLR